MGVFPTLIGFVTFIYHVVGLLSEAQMFSTKQLTYMGGQINLKT